MINIELVKDGVAPKLMSEGASGYDVFAREIFYSGENKATIHLGFKIDTTQGFEDAAALGTAAFLIPRSGWGTKFGVALMNTIGLIDMDYRGEVILKIKWDKKPTELCRGARVGQMVLVPCLTEELNIIAKLSDTERGEGGFGSTGSE